jgi:hypothetical protein
MYENALARRSLMCAGSKIYVINYKNSKADCFLMLFGLRLHVAIS